MWEQSPTARLVWSLALASLLFGFGAAALATGDVAWIAAFLGVLSIGAVQVAYAGPAEGRLWDSWLTRVIYVYVATSGIYLFGRVAFETGDATAVVLLLTLIGVIVIQWALYLRGRGKQSV